MAIPWTACPVSGFALSAKPTGTNIGQARATPPWQTPSWRRLAAQRVASPSGMPRRIKSLVFTFENRSSKARFRVGVAHRRDLGDHVDLTKHPAVYLPPH